MNKWVQCGRCGLKHREREDGLCPRCKQGANAYAPPAVPQSAPSPPLSKPPSTASEVHLGARIAGALMVLNGFIVAYEAFAPGFESETSSFGSRSFIFDFIIGTALVLGSAKFLIWAKIRVVLGVIVFVIIHLATGDMFLAVFQLILSGSLIGLLFGEPGKLRMGLCSAGFFAYFAMGILGIFVMETGGNPIARSVLELSGDIEPIPEDRIVYGVDFLYTLEVPADYWSLRKASAFKQDNPVADRWLIWPEKDAHVLVIAERLDLGGGYVDIDMVADVVVENMEEVNEDVEILDQSTLAVDIESAQLLHIRSVTDGMRIEYLVGIFVEEDTFFQVFTFASEEAFPIAKKDLNAIIASFRFEDY